VLIAFLKMIPATDLPLVSLITINFNSTPVTVALLQSLQKFPYPNLEVIVVDNASQQDPTAVLKEVMPTAIIMRSETNLGFAGGNNLGVKQATGKYLFFINNDTEVTENAILKLVAVLQSHANAGAVCPKFHFFFHPGVLEYAGYNRMNFFTARATMRGNKEIDSGQFNQLEETHYAHGGGMLVPRSVIETIGMMPEYYFLYYEELDWCEMMKRSGFKIYIEPNALIYHKESMSTGKASPLKTYYLTRNRILFIRRNATTFQRLTFLFYFGCIIMPKHTQLYILKREWRHLQSFYKAVVWNFTNPSRT